MRTGCGLHNKRRIFLLQESLEPAAAYARSKATKLSDFLQRQRNLDIAIPGNRGAQSWLLTTYLDDVSHVAGYHSACQGHYITALEV